MSEEGILDKEPVSCVLTWLEEHSVHVEMTGEVVIKLGLQVCYLGVILGWLPVD